MIICRLIKLPIELGSNSGLFIAALESKYEMAGGQVVAVLKEAVEKYTPKLGVNGEPMLSAAGKPMASLEQFISYEIHVRIDSLLIDKLAEAEQSMMKRPEPSPDVESSGDLVEDEEANIRIIEPD